MKLNFIKLFKKRNFKEKTKKQKNKNKKHAQKKSKKCYICEKIKHFVKNYKLTNMMNWLQFNVLQTIFMKKEFKEMCENIIDVSKIITNEKYNWMNEVHDNISKDLKKLILSTKLISRKKRINFN